MPRRPPWRAVLVLLLISGVVTVLIGLGTASNDWLTGEAKMIEGLSACIGSAVLILKPPPRSGN